MSKGSKKLIGKRLKYADGIICGLTPMESAIAAGYTPGPPARAAIYRHSHDERMQQYIAGNLAIRQEERRRKVEVDDVWVTEQFKEIYARCMQGVPVMQYNREERRMEQATNEDGQGVWTFDANGANRAMENIAKHIGYYENDNKQKRAVIKVGIVVTNNHYNDQNKIDEGEAIDVG